MPLSQTFTIDGRLDALNDVVNANRVSKYKGAKMKKDNQSKVMMAIRKAGLKPFGESKVRVSFRWVEPNRRRDPDNVASACKFILDGLQEAGIIEGDSQRHIAWPIIHDGDVDKDNPRIEVVLEEVE